MFRLFSRNVAVSFIDDATGEEIARSKVPLDQLPDTFARNTQLDMAGAHYVVAAANPLTKPEFAKTRRLTVRLQKVEMVDPNSLLFTLPSICGVALPMTAPGPASADVVVLHEDDWRQCEFVDVSRHQDISAELAAIRHVRATSAVGVGFRDVHVRDRISDPLPKGITWAAVTEQLGAFEPIGGVALQDRSNRVVGAAAARLPDNVNVWGLDQDGELTALCVENLAGASPATIAALRGIADTFSLALLDWCVCRVYSSSGAPIEHAVGLPWADFR
jgi:hypothetical protein